MRAPRVCATSRQDLLRGCPLAATHVPNQTIRPSSSAAACGPLSWWGGCGATHHGGLGAQPAGQPGRDELDQKRVQPVNGLGAGADEIVAVPRSTPAQRRWARPAATVVSEGGPTRRRRRLTARRPHRLRPCPAESRRTRRATPATASKITAAGHDLLGRIQQGDVLAVCPRRDTERCRSRHGPLCGGRYEQILTNHPALSPVAASLPESEPAAVVPWPFPSSDLHR